MTYSNQKVAASPEAQLEQVQRIMSVGLRFAGAVAAGGLVTLGGALGGWTAAMLATLLVALAYGGWVLTRTQEARLSVDDERVKAALQTCQQNVMIADANYDIVYMNETMQEMMQAAEADLREELRNFDSRTLLGANIDIFHRNPSYQRGLLDRLNAPHRTKLTVGTRNFGLIATPVFDGSGQRTGTVVEWEDRTALEQELRRQALDFAEGEAKLAALDRVQAVIEFELDGTIITANENFCAAMGYSLDEIKGRHHSMFAEPDYAGSADYKAFWDRLRAGEFASGEYKRLAKHGREIWINASYNPILDEDGKPYKVVKFATDVTAQKTLSADMQGQIDAISKSQAVIEFELDGTIITANENFCQTVGYSLEEIKGRHHSMFADADVAASPEYRRFWDKLGRGEYDSGEYERVGRGGRRILIQASYNPILDLNGKPYKVVKYATDLTQSERMKENARIRSALDNATTNVMVADAGFNIVYMNHSQQEMMQEAEADLRKVLKNFNADRLLGENMDVFHANPAHQRGMLERLTSSYQTEIKVGGRSFELIASPVMDDAGERVGTVVEWKDQTAEKAIEAEVDDVVAAVSRGDFSKQINLDGKSGFMRALAENINQLSGTVSGVLDGVSTMLRTMSEGDLTRRIEGQYQGVYATLRDSANETAERLADTVKDITLASTEVASGADQISTGANDLSQRTEQQAANLEETAASMQEMAATIKQNADNSQQASQLAVTARDAANKGGDVVSDAVGAMGKIEDSSRRISDIIGVIDEIAFQTNLLALNAAVEAARAGDAGRGFAVVASEVRSLAQRSAQAAKDIKDLIIDSTEQVQGGVELVNRTGEALEEIVDSIKRVSDIVAEISAASREQATGADEINTAITQMDEMTQQNSALVEENAAAARTMTDQAVRMRQRVDFFTVDGVEPSGAVTPHPASSAPRSARRAVAGARGLQSALAESVIDEEDDWTEF